MKRKFLATILLLVSIVMCSHAQSHADADVAVNKFQTLYNTHQAESIFNMLSDKIKTLMPLDQTTKAMNQLHDQCGELKSYSYLRQEQHISFYKAKFANTTMTLAVAVDKDSKLEAFRFLPYNNDDKKTAAPEPSNFIYKSPTGNIYGSLVMPR